MEKKKNQTYHKHKVLLLLIHFHPRYVPDKCIVLDPLAEHLQYVVYYLTAPLTVLLANCHYLDAMLQSVLGHQLTKIIKTKMEYLCVLM